MTIFQAIILGLVQGITEFLPISSSGHLLIFPEVLHWPLQDYDFDVTIHLATLLAVIWVLRLEVKNILLGLFKKNNKFGQLGWKIALATIPAVILGLVVSQHIDAVRTTQLVAINLIIWGVVLWIADIYETRLKTSLSKVELLGWQQTFLTGCAQAIALIPGTSRSGITMSAGMFLGLNRETAARFSFLLGIPAILGAGALTFFDALENGLSTPIPALVAGFITAFLFGVIAIKFLLKFLVKSNFRYFALYRILLGISLLIFLV
ncbi:MAG: undecaprenyl-diphosphatase UppP [Patescibacteria group bacterium]|nr:undecaprenyl-diphosphatase UppP [Patescibacteria group bacterium]